MLSGRFAGSHGGAEARPRLLKEIGTFHQNPGALAIGRIAAQTVPNRGQRKTIRRAGFHHANAGKRPQQTMERRRIDLKPKEYALLEFLVRNSDRPVTKSLIIEHVWNIHFDSVSNVVEVHINALRNKIDRGFERPLIHTIRGVGYILTDAPTT